jgi:hypothetical protein
MSTLPGGLTEDSPYCKNLKAKVQRRLKLLGIDEAHVEILPNGTARVIVKTEVFVQYSRWLKNWYVVVRQTDELTALEEGKRGSGYTIY